MSDLGEGGNYKKYDIIGTSLAFIKLMAYSVWKLKTSPDLLILNYILI